MVQVQTSRFGNIEIDQESIITINGGLIGFPDETRFVVIRHTTDSPFFWLQAVDSPELAFVIVDPLVFKPDYQVPLDKNALAGVGAQSGQEVEIYVIVTIPPGRPEGMTANLLGPILVNSAAKKARQIVLDERVYSHQHLIMAPKK